ncbi:hypothetical protein OYT1_ch1629 [Ferriphaselus amnicola]|uniref:Uncharacterized protein n=1 Tax=Ferriphaselus amnicola TaxID=1188319 RepID=A0A2Z6GCE7_9PROT|nr:hypothetical protein [Ferriphaselus amnicola]BBE51176.1 hypothetical protein OYT1_ch1629 [Ferriphaselus amnicola]
MSDRDEKIVRLQAALNEATSAEIAAPVKPKRAPRKKPAPPTGNVIYVNGDGVAAGQIAGGDIHNHQYTQPPRSPRVTVTPGDGVISNEQKIALTALRDEWITLHNSIKKQPLGFGAAWSRINKAAGVTSYHLIQADRYDAAVAYVRKQIAILRGKASAPAKDKQWRSARIGAIKARCNNQLGDPEAYKAYIRKNFSAESLADLATDELQRTYAYIMAKKPGQ